jgi:hypothetical protein
MRHARIRPRKSNRNVVLAHRILKQTGQTLLDVNRKLVDVDDVLGRMGLRGEAMPLAKRANSLARDVADLMRSL